MHTTSQTTKALQMKLRLFLLSLLLEKQPQVRASWRQQDDIPDPEELPAVLMVLQGGRILAMKLVTRNLSSDVSRPRRGTGILGQGELQDSSDTNYTLLSVIIHSKSIRT